MKFLSSRSGRTERQASKEASNINRIPPAFTRRPSRRQIRRNVDSTPEKTFETDNNRKFETKSISVPQPAFTYVKVLLIKEEKKTLSTDVDVKPENVILNSTNFSYTALTALTDPLAASPQLSTITRFTSSVITR